MKCELVQVKTLHYFTEDDNLLKLQQGVKIKGQKRKIAEVQDNDERLMKLFEAHDKESIERESTSRRHWLALVGLKRRD